MMIGLSVLVITALLSAGDAFFLNGDNWQQAYNYNSNSMSSNSCGCVHGTCSQMTMNGVHTETCYCHFGWEGQKCDSSTTTQHNYNSCGCLHGTCSQTTMNGVHTETCYCYFGWEGTKCDLSTTRQQHHQHHHDNNSCGCVHGTCTQVIIDSVHTATCDCTHGWEGQKCDQSISHTTAYPPTTQTLTTQTPTTSTTAATTTMPLDFSSCNKFTTVMQIADALDVTNENALECPSGKKASSEAFVLVHCDTSKTPSTWEKGVKVNDHCSGIPLYTPVAVFSGDDHYQGPPAWSGIFVGCLTGGFRLAHQLCDQPANFTHVISGGTGNMDPSVYYTIQ